MANEQIMVTFGADLSPLGTSFRGLNKMAHGAAAEMKEAFNTKEIFGKFKEGLALVGLSFGAEKLIEMGNAAMEYADHIRNLSEELGVSTTFLQQWQRAAVLSGSSAETADAGLSKLVLKLGQAKEGNQESVDAFEKNGIAIKGVAGEFLSSEEVFENVKTKINSIEDASLKSAVAVEIFGKKGQQLIETMKGFDKTKSTGVIVSERDLMILENFNKSKLEFKMDVNANVAKVEASVLDLITGGAAGINAAIAVYEKHRDDDAQKNQERKMTPEEIRHSKELAEAMVKLRIAHRDLGLSVITEEEKLLKLYLEKADIQQRMSHMINGSLEYVKAETELVKKQGEIKSETLEVEKKIKDTKEKQHILDIKRNELAAKLNLESVKKFSKDVAEFMPTLQAIAESGRWVDSGVGGINGRHQVWQANPFASQAQELMGLKSDASDAILWGDHNRFKADKQRMDQIKMNLENAGLQTPEMTMEMMEEHLKFLHEQAAGAGLKIDVEDS